MKNQKGFVVSLKLMMIIISVTIVIAIPIVLIIVDNSRKNAMKDIARRVNDASHRYFVSHMEYEKSLQLDLEKDMDKLEIAGSKPNGGIIYIDSMGNVSFAIYNEYWCVTKKEDSDYEFQRYKAGNCSL